MALKMGHIIVTKSPDDYKNSTHDNLGNADYLSYVSSNTPLALWQPLSRYPLNRGNITYRMNKNLAWTEAAWSDYLYWQSQDKKTLQRINKLILNVLRAPLLILGAAD
jgi:hypothetical protein